MACRNAAHKKKKSYVGYQQIRYFNLAFTGVLLVFSLDSQGIWLYDWFVVYVFHVFLMLMAFKATTVVGARILEAAAAMNGQKVNKKHVSHFADTVPKVAAVLSLGHTVLIYFTARRDFLLLSKKNPTPTHSTSDTNIQNCNPTTPIPPPNLPNRT
jgi:hypothetical protein